MASPGDEPSAAEAARIHAQLLELQALDPQALELRTRAQAPLRLYGARGGRVVRVLDEHGELSPRALEAIGRFLDAGGESDASGGPNHRLEDGDARSEVNAIAVAAVRKEKDFDEKVQGGVSVDEDDDLGAVETGAEEKDEEMAVAEDVAVDVVGNEVEDAESSSSVSTVVAEATASQDDVAAQEPLIATPQQLLDQQLTAEMWLQGVNSLHDALHPSEDQVNTSTATPSAAGQLESCSVAVALDQSALLLNWPSHLEERRRVWFSAPNSLTSNRTRTVIYWMQNCFRVENSNFALESAVMLAKRLQAPLMIVTLVRSSVVYPVCHAPTASDAYLRWCLLEISDRCAEANVPLHAVTSTWSSTDSASRSELSNALEWTRHPLFTALDAFHPNIVVTDTPFDATSGGDVTRLAQHMEANQSLSPWTLISVDSSSYIPIHNISMHARASLEPKAPVLSEDEFGNEYSNAQVHMSRQGFNTGSATSCLKKLVGAHQVLSQSSEVLYNALKNVGLEMIDLEIVRGIAAGSSSDLPTFTEQSGHKALDLLLAEFDHRPAIQAELQGSGVMSLLPFVRQGSLYSGYILQRISEAVDFFPTPTTPQDRKALAMLKVMRSRALTHLARERDYSLYLALWTTAQYNTAERNSQETQRSSHLMASSKLIESLKLSALILSPLDAYTHLLPSWIDNSVRVGVHDNNDGKTKQGSGTSSYGPYDLESGRTQDAYWNSIQGFFVRHQYIHPMLAVYWSYRVLEWSTSLRAGVAMIDALVSKCAIGPPHSPDAVFMIWNALFMRTRASKPDVLLDATTFQRVLEIELNSQPKLQLS